MLQSNLHLLGVRLTEITGVNIRVDMHKMALQVKDNSIQQQLANKAGRQQKREKKTQEDNRSNQATVREKYYQKEHVFS